MFSLKAVFCFRSRPLNKIDLSRRKIFNEWAVIVAQLVESWLPKQRSADRIRTSENVISYQLYLSCIENDENKEKRGRDLLKLKQNIFCF